MQQPIYLPASDLCIALMEVLAGLTLSHISLNFDKRYVACDVVNIVTGSNFTCDVKVVKVIMFFFMSGVVCAI